MAIPETEAGTGNNCAPPVVFTLIPSRTLPLSNIACSGRRQLTKSLNTEDQDNDGLWLFPPAVMQSGDVQGLDCTEDVQE